MRLDRQATVACGLGVSVLFLAILLLFSLEARAENAGDIGDESPVMRSPFISVGRLVRPAVANIRITRSITDAGVDINPLQDKFRQFFPGGEEGGGESFELPSTGSGFLADSEGHIMTNHHVIARAEAIFVRFTGQRAEYPATVTGSDPNTDLALLHIDSDALPRPLEFSDSDKVEVGAWAIAVGNPFGNLEGSLTVGVVSAKGRGDLVISGGAPRYQDFLQTDAPINFGNSGGPLVDIRGHVIGVNTAVNTGGQGISFAVPSNLALRVFEQLRAHGRVIRGYIGVRTAAVPEGSGVEILQVLEDSPALAAGLQAGDVIVSFAGKPVVDRRDFQFLVAESETGRELACEYRRAGTRRNCTVLLAEMPAGAGAGAEEVPHVWLGLDVASLADESPKVQRLKDALGLTAGAGVMVVKVQEDGPAFKAGIRPGDVLVTIDGHRIDDLAVFQRIRALLAERLEPLEILVRTGDVENYILVQPARRVVDQ